MYQSAPTALAFLRSGGSQNTGLRASSHRLPSHISKMVPPTVHIGPPKWTRTGVRITKCQRLHQSTNIPNFYAASARIHRRRASGRRPEAARRCSCASGIMVLQQQTGPGKGAPNRC